MGELPSISIVIPNFNGEAYLERAIRSALDQDYPRLEIIVVDGGSTDRSVEIIRRYETKLTYWISEKDRGQANAINKGFARASGDIVNWLCSDDRLMPGALLEVGTRFILEPSLDVLIGGCNMEYLGDPSRSGPHWTALDAVLLIPCTNPINQPSCFYRRGLLRPGKPLDESYNYAMDTELWCYFLARKVRWGTTEAVLSEYLHTGVNKTMTGGKKILRELDRLYQAYTDESLPMCTVTRCLLHPLEKYTAAYGSRWQGRVTSALYSLVWHVSGRAYGFDRLGAHVNSYRFFDPPRPGPG